MRQVAGTEPSRRSRPIGLLLALSLIAGGWALPGCSAAEEIPWDRLADGLHVAVWVPGPRCADLVPTLVLVRIDPDRYRFEIYHYRDEGLAAPLTIHEWQERTQASIVFNAGLFAQDYSYLGLLVKQGRSLGTELHPRWKGLFVAEPTAPGHRNARIVDLERESFASEQSVYQEAAQSLMLVDATGQPRVRHTGKRAQQTVVGEDRAGNILLIKTAHAVPMWELAVCLRDGIPAFRHAMAMDGGASSDILFATRLLAEPNAEPSAVTWRSLVDGSSPMHIPLPAVIAVKPRATASAQSR